MLTGQQTKTFLEKIISERRDGTRRLPSNYLTINNEIYSRFTTKTKKELLDFTASIVDHHSTGRSERGVDFARLLAFILGKLGFKVEVILGLATYSDANKSFVWKESESGYSHAWLLFEGDELIDGNADSMSENPYFSLNLNPQAFWGSKDELPADRIFDERTREQFDNLDLDSIIVGINEFTAKLDKRIVLRKIKYFDKLLGA
jgi:hypothetical protein